MLLAIDIGNSSTKFGIFGSDTLIDKFSIPTARDYTVSELLFDRLRYVNERFYQIDAVIVASVVPEMNQPVSDACVQMLKVTPSFVDASFELGIDITYEPPEAAGIDRLVNASAAVAKYSSPVVVCSLGTATTIDVVDRSNRFLGGTISPGMRTLAESLHSKASKLPLVTIEKPQQVVGRSTESSIKSGVFYGYIGLVEGILERTFTEIEERPKVIATGGFARLVSENTTLINTVDETLLLEGLFALSKGVSA